MRKRPLCFVCITLVMIMWILHTSGGRERPSDIIFSEDNNITIIGKIYQCEYKNNYQILYLKQTSLFANFPNLEMHQKDVYLKKLNNVRITLKIREEISVGDIISAKGMLDAMEGASNPGQFDVEKYYQSKKIGYTMWNPKVELLERPKVSILRGLWKIRMALADNMDQILPNQLGAVLKGMTLGDKTSISDETKMSFQYAGISHLLAISGLHLQMLGNGLYKFLRKIRFGTYISAIASGMFLIAYGILTGNSVATVRALIMFLLNVGADVTGRTYDGATGISLTALVLVAGNPGYIYSSGFWLSFCAVSTFILFKEKRKLLSSIIFYCFMAPITLYYFYELPLYSTIINLLVVPTAGIVLVSGLMGAIGTFGGLGIGKVLVFPAAMLLRIYNFLCDINKKIPYHTIILGKPSFLQMILYYSLLLLMLILFRKNALRIRRFLVLLLTVPAVLILLYRGVWGIQITMLDVGQGDSLVIRTETGNTYLIDGGSTSKERVAEYRILPYLKHEGVCVLSGIFISHADADHMNGIKELLELIQDGKAALTVERILIPDWENIEPFTEIIRQANDLDIEICRFMKGDKVADGKVTIECIHPAGMDYVGNMNEGSMVLRLGYKSFSMLFTGDLEGDAETEIASKCGDIDILKVGHHGSETSSGEVFLNNVRAEIALISCGRNNIYGHPHEEVVQRLTEDGTVIFRTDRQGAITIRTNGEKIDLKTYKQYNVP